MQTIPKTYKVLNVTLFLTGVVYVAGGLAFIGRIGFLIVFLGMFAVGSTVVSVVNAVGIRSRSRPVHRITAVFNALVMLFCILYLTNAEYMGWPIVTPLLVMMVQGLAVTSYSFAVAFPGPGNTAA